MNWKYFSKMGLALLVLALALPSCYKESNWLDDNVTPGKGNFPVIATLTLVNGNMHKRGETAQLDLRYWSVDQIKEIQLNSIIGGVSTLVSTTPYTSNFAADSQTDKLILDYPVPANLDPAVTKVSLEVKVINDNTLSRTSKVDITITN